MPSVEYHATKHCKVTGNTWLWYKGHADDLDAFIKASQKRWPHMMYSNKQVFSTTQFPFDWIFVQGFIFKDRSDAMLFKLSH